ncbi:Leucine-rich repeat extensin-like protein 4 [Linum perenne]
MPTTTVFLLLLLTVVSSAAAPVPGLDTFLTTQSHVDPQASNDSFESLPSSLKKSLSSLPHSANTINSLISSLLSLSLPLSLHLRLVGSAFPSADSSADILSSFFSSTHTSDHFHVITPDPVPPHQNSHRLALRHSPHLDVSHSPPSFSSRLSDAIKSAISSTPTPLRSSLLSIPYDTVDHIIRQEYDKEKPAHGIYIYLISLGSQSKNYAYSYSPGDSSPGFTKCSGTIWTGKERYLWIDLSAGPVDYGPALSGDGVLPRGEFHPLAAMHGRPKSHKALLSDLASLVWSAYQVLLVPSLRIPVHFDNSLLVQFVHIYASKNGKDQTGLDWKAIERTFRDGASEDGLLLGDQSLTFKSYEVKYEECSICSYAISKSVNSYTSRFLFDNYTLIVSEYLDSKRLHQILSDSAEEFKRVAGIPEVEEEDYVRVLPVYVFDLDYSMLLLLDRYHQSVSFRDMVVAVRTRTTQTVSDYSCNGCHVFTHTRDLERPLVGSILQSMWGVSPTHLSWSARHNTTLVDYTWSVGQTPFGPFSESSALSFVQKDAARRNVLLTSLNYSITSAVEVLGSMQSHGGDRKLLKGNQHVEFVRRWNLFKHKIDKAISAMSRLDFEMALYYLRSSDHDLFAIHSLVYHASHELEASLVCFKDPPFPWSSVSLSAVGFFGAIISDPLNITGNWVGTDVCSYEGVFCAPAPDNRTIRIRTVTDIDINHGDIAGYLPEELGLLVDLAFIHINSNRFCSTVPHKLKKLKRLYKLDLSNNRFAGTFPNIVLQMPKLKFLDLRFNELEEDEGFRQSKNYEGSSDLIRAFHNSNRDGSCDYCRSHGCTELRLDVKLLDELGIKELEKLIPNSRQANEEKDPID